MTKYLRDHDIKHSYTIAGSLVLDDELAMQIIPRFKREQEIREPSFEDFKEKMQEDTFTFSLASSRDLPYIVCQVTLKEKFLGTGSGNLTELEDVINHYYQNGYRLHTVSTSSGGSKGGLGGDRIQATLVFEKIGLFT